MTVLTAVVPDATGYGRIVRDGNEVARIVEHADATDAELDLTEINSGIYVFDAATLTEGLAALEAKNSQGELYLTDVLAHARASGRRVGAQIIADYLQTEGVNDRAQLADRSAELNRRILARWMADGVTVLDPASTWVHAGVDLAEDVTLLPGTSLEGATSVARGATIGPDTTLHDCEVGEDARVIRTHAELAVIGPGATVGPFAYLRPGTELGAHAHVGAFVAVSYTHLDVYKRQHSSEEGDHSQDRRARCRRPQCRFGIPGEDRRQKDDQRRADQVSHRPHAVEEAHDRLRAVLLHLHADCVHRHVDATVADPEQHAGREQRGQVGRQRDRGNADQQNRNHGQAHPPGAIPVTQTSRDLHRRDRGQPDGDEQDRQLPGAEREAGFEGGDRRRVHADDQPVVAEEQDDAGHGPGGCLLYTSRCV